MDGVWRSVGFCENGVHDTKVRLHELGRIGIVHDFSLFLCSCSTPPLYFAIFLLFCSWLMYILMPMLSCSVPPDNDTIANNDDDDDDDVQAILRRATTTSLLSSPPLTHQLKSESKNQSPQLTTLIPLSLPHLNHSTPSNPLPLSVPLLCSSQTPTSNFLTTPEFCPIPYPSKALSKETKTPLVRWSAVAKPAMKQGKTTSRRARSPISRMC